MEAVTPALVGGSICRRHRGRHSTSLPRKRRVRTLVKYGMTVSQAADLYGVPVETIERILRKA
jgi:transposase